MTNVANDEAPQPSTTDGWFAGRLARERGCVVIAEVAQAHDGSLGLAHAFIDAVAAAGVDAVKFQTHIAAAESTPAEPWRVRFSPQDETRYDVLAAHGVHRGPVAGAPRARGGARAPVPELAVLRRGGRAARAGRRGRLEDRLRRGHQPRRCSNAVLDTELPVLLSTGMSPLRRDRRARSPGSAQAGVPARGAAVHLAPTPARPEQVGLNLLAELRERYGCPVGLSDHSGTIYPGARRGDAGRRGARGARHAEPRDVRPRRRRLGHHGGAAAAGRGRPLHRADAGRSGRQGRGSRRRLAPLRRTVHEERGRPGATCRRARCCGRSTSPCRKPGTGLPRRPAGRAGGRRRLRPARPIGAGEQLRSRPTWCSR